MKKKTINAIICKKFDEWLETITDPQVKKLVKDGTIMTGGAICSMLLNEPVNDYDFYFKDIATTEAVAKYYVNTFLATRNGVSRYANGRDIAIEVRSYNGRVEIFVKNAGVANEDGSDDYRYFEADSNPEEGGSEQYVNKAVQIAENKSEGKAEYRPVFMTSNAITLSDNIQIVVRFYGQPDQLHENYDFVHCTNYWTSWERRVTLRPKALEAILSKELVYVGSKYPLCSIFRLRKFISRGWSITAGQTLKILLQINQLPLTNLEVLKDQLTGVDNAYFRELIEKLQSKDPARVDCAYIVNLIDAIV